MVLLYTKVSLKQNTHNFFQKDLGATHKDYKTQDQQEQNHLLLTC